MTAPIVRTAGLTKRYRDHTALTDVDLAVPTGGVYGLVGPNGAGKTTLLSLLLGLRRPTSGTLHLAVDRSSIAAVPDTPQFDPWLTAREVVDLSRHLLDPTLPTARVAQALERTGLADAADRRCGGFSRGMLQRLGLAAAVVGEPELLLLDELLVGRAAPAVRVHVRGDAAALAQTLQNRPWVSHLDVDGPHVLRVITDNPEHAEVELVPALAAAGARVVSLTPERGDLEQVFLELTSSPKLEVRS